MKTLCGGAGRGVSGTSHCNQWTSPGISMVLHLLLSPGDESIIPTPHYACYPNMVKLCGANPVLIETSPEDGYRLDIEKVKAAINRKPVNSNSFTSKSYRSSPASRGHASLSKPGYSILSDEIYDGLIFDGVTNTSPAQFTDNIFIFDGFSKRYAMTGFRLGYLIIQATPCAPCRPCNKICISRRLTSRR